MIENNIHSIFKEKFDTKPLLAKSPGRINLIGEHTDYNDGFVLPAAIDKYIYFAIAKNDTDTCNVYSYDFREFVSFPITQKEKINKGWANYLIGIINEFQKHGKEIKGFDLVFGGNIPIGAGLSSSAALETGLAFVLNLIFDLNLDTLELIKLSQKAENNFVGVNCGIMDQFAAMKGKSNHVIKLDCRNLEYEYLPFEAKDYQLLLCNSNVKHNLVSSEYNKRRKQCEEGVKILSNKYQGIKKLRDVTLENLISCKEELGIDVFNKCSYVVEENQRLLNACNELKSNDLTSFGELMYQTHKGLREKYEVSCKELDFLVDLTKNFPEIPGSRMMGGGFGGCSINLIRKDFKQKFIQLTLKEYKAKFGIDAEFYDINIVDGTGIVE